MTVRLSIHFKDEVAMMEWFEEIKEKGGFGSTPHAEFPETAQTPRKDVGVRRIDALDNQKVKAGKAYIVAGTRDPGQWVRLHEWGMREPYTEIVAS